MRLILSNYGLRFLTHQQAIRDRRDSENPVLEALFELSVRTWRRPDNGDLQRELLRRGLVQIVSDDLNEDALRLRYQRNPLEHVDQIVFEFTTACSFNCAHCRNGSVRPVTDTLLDDLCDIVDSVVPLGVLRFNFIGGEVTLHGDGWLDVVRHAKSVGAETICVLSNGWFLGQHGFTAAGEQFTDDSDYLAELARAGVTHLVFSLDGPESLHDQSRSQPGLFKRIMDALPRVRRAGLEPRVSLVLFPGQDQQAMTHLMEDLACQLYRIPRTASSADKISRLLTDRTNYVSNFIDIGNGCRMRQGRFAFATLPDCRLRCKNYFRPYPALRVQASGEVSLCPLLDAGEGFGNVHERSFIELLNRIQESFVYQLHAQHELPRYRRFLFPDLFGQFFDHPCTVRAVLTLIARQMHEGNVSFNDTDKVREIANQVAQRSGFLPRT